MEKRASMSGTRLMHTAIFNAHSLKCRRHSPANPRQS
jgi:hypothetical protein